MNIIQRILYYRPNIENALSSLDKGRLKLPILLPQRLFKDFSKRPVSFYEVPSGPWSSPVVDVLMLLKIIVCEKPKKVIEIGSYLGHTTLAIARHLDDDAKVVALDMNEKHGKAYKNTSFANKIERRVCSVSKKNLENDQPNSFDLIFLDAGHSYDEVKYDTELLLPLLANNGYFVWHDYANWGKFSKKNEVPEYLHELSQYMPLGNISGTWLAIYSPYWETYEGKEKFKSASIDAMSLVFSDPWETESIRG